MSEYRIMQASRSSFYVEKFGPNTFGLFPKWRPVGQFVGPISMRMTHYFPTKEIAQDFAKECVEFEGGPKLVAA